MFSIIELNSLSKQEQFKYILDIENKIINNNDINININTIKNKDISDVIKNMI